MSDENSPAKSTNVSATLFNSKIEEEAGKVVGVIFGGAAEGAMSVGGNIFGGLIGDRVREWRTRNLINSMAATAQILKEKGVDLSKAKSIPLAEAYAMFEESSKQDDPTIAGMWAALLANAMDRDCDVDIEQSVISTLKIISGAEASIMRFIREFQLLSNEYTDNRPRYNPPAPEEIEEQSERYATLINEYNANWEEKFDNSRKKYLGDISDIKLQNALVHLIKERCICSHAPKISERRLVYVDRAKRGRDAVIVDAGKVADAINNVASAIDEHSGRRKALPSLQKDSSATARLNYDLTEYGNHLLRICEPIISPTTPTE